MADMACMKVSVVIPLYNKAPYVAECLRSVFSQTLQGFEVIVVDDASTDDGPLIVEAMHDERIKLIRLPRNVGPGMAAQAGMDLAQGEYIIRVDADDIMLPDRFERQLALMDAEPLVGASSGHIRLMHDPTILHRVELEDEACKARMLFGVPLNQPATIYRRKVLVDSGVRFLPEWSHYGEDWLHQLHLASHTRFMNLDLPLIEYRKGAMNIAFGRDRATDLRGLYKQVFSYIGWPITGEEIELQLATVKCFPRPFTSGDVRGFHGWLRRIAALNEVHRTFDQRALQVQLDRLWNELFYHLPPFGWKVAAAHVQTQGTWTFSKIRYLLATMCTGRSRPAEP